jgi:hexosaminidase
MLAASLTTIGCASAPVARPSIIPEPMKMELGDRHFHITDTTRIVVDPATRDSGAYLAQLLSKPLGQYVEVDDSSIHPKAKHSIFLTIDPSVNLGDEGYKLSVTHETIRITAATDAGVFYGIQTLRQLLPVQIEEGKPVKISHLIVPVLTIEDEPRYRWRGFMLDVSRHFFTVDFIKRTLDLMALQKLNTFHWHLTDDQGWRIEIKKYPELTSVGAWRTDDGQRYGGFYTQDQIRDVVQYAAARHITVVPEIEMPGHCVAALAAYPELSSTGGPFKVSEQWGIHYDVYCPGKDSTFIFLQNVLDEVIPLFPGPFLHVGGDEVPKDRWKLSPECQARMKSEHLQNEEELQSYFIKRMAAFIQNKGKRVIGWDEILEGGLANGAAVMSWRGTKGGIAAAQSGHDVVMTPGTNCYLDHYQSDNQIPPKPFKLLPLEKVYSFNPSADLTPEEATHVLGVQGNLWTEQVADPQRADYMAYPRLTAIAEVGWTISENKNWPNFETRMNTFEQRLKILGVDYFPGPTTTTQPATTQATTKP